MRRRVTFCHGTLKRQQIFSRLRAANPASTELEYASPFRAAACCDASSTGDRKEASISRRSELYKNLRVPRRRLFFALRFRRTRTPYRASGLYRTKEKYPSPPAVAALEHGGVPEREARGTAAGRSQNRECDTQCRIRAAGDRSRHSHFRVANRTASRPARTLLEVEENCTSSFPPNSRSSTRTIG